MLSSRPCQGSRHWVSRKGVHIKDSSREAVDAGVLRERPFVPVAALRTGSPVLHPDLLTEWPTAHETVVGLSEPLLRVFDGPRILFPDGFSKDEHTIRTVYCDRPASFASSVGVLAGPPEDAGLLQFAAVYLRSSLARYFLVLRGWKMLCQRNGVHMEDVKSFPFFRPTHAPLPDAARKALREIQSRMKILRARPQLEQAHHYNAMRHELDEAVFDYFGITANERVLIRETVEVLMPAIRPSSLKQVEMLARRRPSQDEVAMYARTLGDALTAWREKTHMGVVDLKLMSSPAILSKQARWELFVCPVQPPHPAPLSSALASMIRRCWKRWHS